MAGTGREQPFRDTLSPASLFIWLSVAHSYRHVSAFPALPPSSRLPRMALGGEAPSAPTADTRMLSVCPACRDGGERLQLFSLHQRLVLAYTELQWRGLSSPKVPGLGPVACAIPTRSRALLVIAAVLEEGPAPAAFPAASLRCSRGWSHRSHVSAWAEIPLCRWGEETRGATAAPWETKAMFTPDSFWLAGT